MTSAITTSAWNGITAQTATAGISTISGAIRYMPRLTCVGIMTSLSSSFSTSAIGCSRPSGPTRFGPRRTCIQPISLRSHRIR
ncbi:hypothetical protein D3C81_1248470 [compost metagenome]